MHVTTANHLAWTMVGHFIYALIGKKRQELKVLEISDKRTPDYEDINRLKTVNFSEFLAVSEITYVKHCNHAMCIVRSRWNEQLAF